MSSSRTLPLVAGLWLCLILACSNSRNSEPAPTNGPRVEAADLVKQYESNEVAADNEYKGKALTVSGVIDKVGKDIADSPYVTLGADGIFQVQCMFENLQDPQLSRLRPGQKIILVGICDGKFGNVLLRRCSVY